MIKKARLAHHDSYTQTHDWGKFFGFDSVAEVLL